MVIRKGGARKRTRALMTKNKFTRGKLSLRKFFMEYAEGDKATLVAEPTYQDGMFPLRFYGKNAIVCGKRGDCYLVTIKDGSKIKTLIVHPIHLRKIVSP